MKNGWWLVLEENISEIGTDINTNWSFLNGDLVLVDNDENLVQSIRNRLTCPEGSFDLYYGNYGSVLEQFMGWRRRQETLDFMKIEVENCLDQDPRIQDYNVELSFENKSVRIDLQLNYSEDSDLSLSLVLNNEGVVVSDGG